MPQRQRIFVGSSGEQRPLAEVLAQALSQSGYTVVRWWEAFPPTGFTLETLAHHAQNVDGAVFLCFGDDRTWYRGEKTASVRDNVMFELGLFLSHVKRQRALVVADQGVRLPTDLLGLTYLPHNDPSTTKEQVVEYFNRIFNEAAPPPPEVVQLEAHSGLSGGGPVELPPDFVQRSLYVGPVGARAWQEISNDPRYMSPDNAARIRGLIRHTIDGLSVQAFVSLGSGDGEPDRAVILDLMRKTPLIRYVPVDINHALLYQALAKMNHEALVPFGLLADFERHLPLIKRRLDHHRVSPALFGMLGNTFGNLDLGEDHFLASLRAFLRPGDYVLLEVAIKQKGWELATDPRAMAQSYPEPYRRLIANGIMHRRGLSQTEYLDIIANFESRLQITVGFSNVDEATAIVVRDQNTKLTGVKTCRYDWAKLLERIGKDFKIVSENKLAFADSSIGAGAVVFKL